MTGKKRSLEESSSTHRAKKSKVTDTDHAKRSVPATTEVDFPRGGGTSFTPLEVKTIRAEAIKEADKELFQDTQNQTKAIKRKRKKYDIRKDDGDNVVGKTERIRIEHLNYKRINVGMKILGQVISIQSLALIVSLPNQLFGHIPLTNIASQYTALLEAIDGSENESGVNEDDQNDEERLSRSHTLDLSEMFYEGQYIRCVVTVVHAHGSTDGSVIAKTRDEVARSSRRVELSLIPERVNAGVQRSDLKPGFAITAAVKSVEDHGYILDLGIPDISGFLKDTQKKFAVGQVIDTTVDKMSSNGRTCHVEVDPSTFSTSLLSEVANASSILPGALVHALITSVHSNGLNLQLCGFFEGTVDQLHLPKSASAKAYGVGKKVKARVLYNFSSSPPRFALALAEHILALVPRLVSGRSEETGTLAIQAAYPVGMVLDSVKIARIESERGVIVEVQSDLEGFIHISHVSDDHVSSLSPSSPWKVGSLHRARVTGYFSMDGLLQLSLKSSVIEQKFLQIADVTVGEVIKGTVKKLTETALFVSLSGNIDGVIWPNHYADINLKQPSKRFKIGMVIKCRVLSIDNDHRRISLTAKKTLLESNLPAISELQNARVGLVTHAVVFKVSDKYLIVEFYNNLKAVIPTKEVSETPITKLADSFVVGRVVKVRIIAVQKEQARITASIRQAAPNFQAAVTDISAVEIGNIVDAVVSEIHKHNVVLTLQTSQIRALISLKNLANHRKLSVAQLCATIKVGDKLEELVVVTRNPEKGFVIVANKPKAKETLPHKNTLSIESITVGQIVGGRVTRHTKNGTLVKITAHIGGILHPTDTCDDYEAGVPFPLVDCLLKASVVSIEQGRKQLTLSTRHSKMYPDQYKTVVDRDIQEVKDLQVGETVRGFVKSVAEHGLFVTLGKGIDARVQIRELFDEFVKEWKEHFKVNQLVKGRILSVDVTTKKIEMSFRTKFLKDPSQLSVGDIQVGSKLDGVVKRIEDYGLFVQLEGSKLTGLCHKSQLSDNKEADVDVALRGFRQGDRVKAIVLKVEKSRISLSLKPSHFGDGDLDDDRISAEGSDQEMLGVVADDAESSGETNTHEDQNDQVDSDIGEDEEGPINIAIESTIEAFQPPNIMGSQESPALPSSSLKLDGGFQWSSTRSQGEESDPDSSSGEIDDEGQPSKKKKRRRKEIEQDVTAEMHTRVPESNADFERVLLGSPNSSYTWIQYMSFQLQLSEFEKAREIGRRAIRTINFREEQERFNIWIALLNLENVYGTDETLETTFKEAARANDAKTMYIRLASILDQSGKHEKAEEQFKRTCKKFGQSSKVWTLLGEYYLRQGELEEARNLLPRCLQSLDKRKHLKTIAKFAQLEYKQGEPERGKTIFEGIVDSHPKRWDLWSIYMDMEAGQGDIQSLRNLFERVLSLKMTSHKAKIFFKKWLELERKLGDDNGVQNVKNKAVEWTQRANMS